jgi:hypothetical protein
MQMLKRYTHLRAEDLVTRIDEASKRRIADRTSRNVSV